ncbi:MAG: hypothetical protein ABIG93_05290 [archaeon]|nr:hypothetical protein [Nanoarchaeota archaeon]
MVNKKLKLGLVAAGTITVLAAGAYGAVKGGQKVLEVGQDIVYQSELENEVDSLKKDISQLYESSEANQEYLTNLDQKISNSEENMLARVDGIESGMQNVQYNVSNIEEVLTTENVNHCLEFGEFGAVCLSSSYIDGDNVIERRVD